MKKIILALIFLFPLALVAQSAIPVPVAAAAPSWLVNLASGHPWIMSVIVFMGAARVFLKPAFAALHTFFQGSGLVAYDQKESAIEQSKVMSIIYFALDYVGSIKLPVPAVAPVASVPSDNSQPPVAS